MAQASAASRKKLKAEKLPPSPRRQRLVRDIALILIAPLLLYLMASLFTFSPTDPGWSHSGSVTAPLHNVGGRVGAWTADVLLLLTGYVAFLLPIMLGLIAWIALFGMGERVYYQPVPRGLEIKLKEKLDALRSAREAARRDDE